MTAFRIFSKLNTFYGQSLQALPSGYLKFYEAGTTTPKNVYGDEELTINNGSQIALDASSRPALDIWGDGSYFIELYNASNVKQGEADDVEIPGSGGLTIPALSSGKYLTNNGSILLWVTVREVPDPTGQAGKVVGTDGVSILWQALPAAVTLPTGGVLQDATTFTIGKLKVQTGTFSAPASGLQQTTCNVTYPTAYTSILHFGWTIHGGGGQAGGPVVGYMNSPASTTGATLLFDVAEGAGAPATIGIAVTGTWISFGIIA